MKKVIVKIANTIGETGLYHRLCPGNLPVFMLHRVHDDSCPDIGGLHADQLRSYLRYLSARHYRILSMDEIRDIVVNKVKIPAKCVAFTIDDGFFDHYQVAASVFDEFHYPLNFFVITGFLDGQLWPWDDQVAWTIHHAKKETAEVLLPEGEVLKLDLQQEHASRSVKTLRERLKKTGQKGIYSWIRDQLFPATDAAFPETTPGPYAPMSWDDARDLVRRGHGVYPHTGSHRILSTLDNSQRESEILDSRRRVEEELKQRVSVFAYPTGRPSDYGRTDAEILERAGFDIAFNTVTDYIRSGERPFDLPRFSLPESGDDFRQIVNRFEAFKARLRS